MKTKIMNLLCLVTAFMALLTIASCNKKHDPSPDTLFATKISHTYGLGTVSKGGEDLTSVFPGFTLKFNSDLTYTSANSPLKAGVFLASGTFAPKAKTGSSGFDVLLDGQTLLTITEATETSLKFTLQYVGSGSRISSISGDYLFAMVAK